MLLLVGEQRPKKTYDDDELVPLLGDEPTTPDDDDIVPLVRDETPDPRDELAHDGFGVEGLDRRSPTDESYAKAPVPIAEIAHPIPIQPDRPTKLAADGGYDFSDDDEEAAPAPKLPKPAVAKVVKEEKCRKCGYILMGLSRGGKCPECGTPILSQVAADRADDLRFADSQWLDKVALGCRIVLWTVIAAFFANLVQSFVIGSLVVAGLLSAVKFGAFAVGYWLMSEPDPSEIDLKPKLRMAVRLCAFAGLLSAGVQLMDAVITSTAGPPLGAGGITVLLAIALVLEFVGYAALPISAFYLQHLGIRGREPSVEDRGQVVAIGLLVVYGAAAIVLGVALLAMFLSPTPAQSAGVLILSVCGGFLVFLMFLVFGIKYLVLLGETSQMLLHAGSKTTNAAGQRATVEELRAREREIAALRKEKMKYRIAP
ncbi:MAG: hypothetical protein AAF561_01010 [Planctomycetota bacterium]